MLKRMVEIVKKSGATAVFCQKGIDDLAQHYLAKQEIYAVRRVKKTGMEKLAEGTRGKDVTKDDEVLKDEPPLAQEGFRKENSGDPKTVVTGCKEPQAGSNPLR